MERAGELIFILIFNCIVIFILYYFQKRLIEKNIKHLKEEVRELEDLVAAIIEEFEDIAESTESQSKPADILSSNQEMNLNYPTVGDFLDNLAENDFNEPVLMGEASRIPVEQADMTEELPVNVTINSNDGNHYKDEQPVAAPNKNRIEASDTGSAGIHEPNKISAIESPVVSKPEAIKPESINDPRHRRILELRQQGITVEDIARQLGTGRGEIQLVLGLYRRS